MSDFLGILVVGGKAIHVVDWSRPAWFDPNDPEGLRVVPDLDHFVADALALMYLNIVDECAPACDRDPNGLNELDRPPCIHVERARAFLYEEFSEPLMFIYPDDQADGYVVRDLAQFKEAPYELVRLHKPLFDRNAWGTC